jgi:hypothetical protein
VPLSLLVFHGVCHHSLCNETRICHCDACPEPPREAQRGLSCLSRRNLRGGHRRKAISPVDQGDCFPGLTARTGADAPSQTPKRVVRQARRAERKAADRAARKAARSQPAAKPRKSRPAAQRRGGVGADDPHLWRGGLIRAFGGGVLILAGLGVLAWGMLRPRLLPRSALE